MSDSRASLTMVRISAGFHLGLLLSRGLCAAKPGLWAAGSVSQQESGPLLFLMCGGAAQPTTPHRTSDPHLWLPSKTVSAPRR